MNLIAPKIGFGKEENFLVLVAGWFLFGSLFQSLRPPPGIFPAWVLLTSAFSIITLSAIGYFQRYTPQPELSGVLSLFLALPFSAVYSKWLFVLVAHAPPIRYLEALRASVWVALVFESSQWLIFRAHRALGRRWDLVAYLFPEDLTTLKTEVERSDSSWWINIHPASAAGNVRPDFSGHETLVISRGAARDLNNYSEFVTAHLRGQRIIDVGQLLKEFRGRVDLHNSDAWTFLLGSTYQSFPIRFIST